MKQPSGCFLVLQHSIIFFKKLLYLLSSIDIVPISNQRVENKMAYIDKCCGACKEYQELKETGKFEYLKYCQVYEPIYKRFESSNVCSDCISKKLKMNIDLFYCTKLTHKVDRSKGWVYYIDDNGKFKKEYASRFDDTAKESKEHPWLYEVFSNNEDINIYDKDKRKLRKTLRKLGIVGKIEQIIK